MVTDNESPPGAWAEEMRRAPWAFGQKKPETVDEVLQFLRQKGYEREAAILTREFAVIKARQSSL